MLSISTAHLVAVETNAVWYSLCMHYSLFLLCTATDFLDWSFAECAMYCVCCESLHLVHTTQHANVLSPLYPLPLRQDSSSRSHRRTGPAWASRRELATWKIWQKGTCRWVCRPQSCILFVHTKDTAYFDSMSLGVGLEGWRSTGGHFVGNVPASVV